MTQHIAMWTCPRSRSTLVTRAFEQLDGCVVFDEPFYAAYLLNDGFEHPHRQETIAAQETNVPKIVQMLTGPLANGARFSFQKQIAKHVPADLDLDWLQSLEHFFLIRHPREMIASYVQVYGKVTWADIGMDRLYDIWQKVRKETGKAPLVVDSTDLLQAPGQVLPVICDRIGLAFSPEMLTWAPNLQNSQLMYTGSLAAIAETWYGTVSRSAGFLPYQPPLIALTDELEALAVDCLPFYNTLFANRLRFV